MAGVNFKICGDRPPFCVELRKDSPTGLLIDSMSVANSGTCETFTSLDYNTCYYLVAEDDILNATSNSFVSCDVPVIPDINLTMVETFNDSPSPQPTECDYCRVCGCIGYSPNISVGQSYSLDICYNQAVEKNSGLVDSLSTVKIFTGITEVFDSSLSTVGSCNGVYTVDNVTCDTDVKFETYSCVCAATNIPPLFLISGCSDTSICLADTDNNVNANFFICTPNDIASDAIACKLPISPSVKTVSSCRFFDNGGYETLIHFSCGCIVNNPAMVSGDRYDVKLDYRLGASLSGDGTSRAHLQLWCNGSQLLCKSISAPASCCSSYTINNVDYNDTITYRLCGRVQTLGITNFANATSCITIDQLSDCQGSDFCIGGIDSLSVKAAVLACCC